uniref:GYF domain-containing protein n=1 Tax=Spongospora subterranea TaxID=70186 RepID=A0A0H5R6X7_9EUKA|eukprot:CRZ09880.1 hypothetical protein [Spongospora subterranea]
MSSFMPREWNSVVASPPPQTSKPAQESVRSTLQLPPRQITTAAVAATVPCRYTKAEMLALFSPSDRAPSDFQFNIPIVSSDCLLPVNSQPPSKAESEIYESGSWYMPGFHQRTGPVSAGSARPRNVAGKGSRLSFPRARSAVPDEPPSPQIANTKPSWRHDDRDIPGGHDSGHGYSDHSAPEHLLGESKRPVWGARRDHVFTAETPMPFTTPERERSSNTPSRSSVNCRSDAALSWRRCSDQSEGQTTPQLNQPAPRPLPNASDVLPTSKTVSNVAGASTTATAAPLKNQSIPSVQPAIEDSNREPNQKHSSASLNSVERISVADDIHHPLDQAPGIITDSWWYQDPSGTVRGPFSSEAMREWYNQQYFHLTLPVKNRIDEAFVPLGALFLQGNPAFLDHVPVIMAAPSPQMPVSSAVSSNQQSGDPRLLRSSHAIQQMPPSVVYPPNYRPEVSSSYASPSYPCLFGVTSQFGHMGISSAVKHTSVPTEGPKVSDMAPARSAWPRFSSSSVPSQATVIDPSVEMPLQVPPVVESSLLTIPDHVESSESDEPQKCAVGAAAVEEASLPLNEPESTVLMPDVVSPVEPVKAVLITQKDAQVPPSLSNSSAVPSGESVKRGESQCEPPRARLHDWFGSSIKDEELTPGKRSKPLASLVEIQHEEEALILHQQAEANALRKQKEAEQKLQASSTLGSVWSTGSRVSQSLLEIQKQEELIQTEANTKPAPASGWASRIAVTPVGRSQPEIGSSHWAQPPKAAVSIRQIQKEQQKVVQSHARPATTSAWSAAVAGPAWPRAQAAATPAWSNGPALSRSQGASLSGPSSCNDAPISRPEAILLAPQSATLDPATNPISCEVGNSPCLSDADESSSGSEDDLFWASNDRSSVTNQPQSKQSSVSRPGLNSNEFGGPRLSPAFQQWCKVQMEGISADCDIALAEFLITLKSPQAIRQYIYEYLGRSSKVEAFATGFLQHKDFDEAKLPVKGRSRADERATSDMNSDAQSSATTKKKKNRRRRKKIDPVLFGFQ